jgi:hypothetical protein
MIRKRCPICFVENTGGNPCRYHFRNREQHTIALREHRVNHWKTILCEYIDEARTRDQNYRPQKPARR